MHPTTSEALSPHNLQSLHRLAAQAPTEVRWLKVFCTTSLVAGALFLAVQRHFQFDVTGLLPTLVLVLGGGGALLWGWTRWRQKRLWQPLRAAVAQGHKQVLRGRLSAVEALDDGRLRYVVDGQAVELLPLAGPLEPHAVPHDARVRGLLALRDVDVALHWIARGPDRLLLELQLPDQPAPTQAVRETAADDLRHAHRQARQLLGFFAVLVPVIALVVASQAGFEARTLGLVLGMCAVTWLLMGGIARLLARQQRLQCTHMHTFTGTLSEQFSTVSQIGNRPAQIWLWYRIGGYLVQVPARIAGVQLGERLTVNYLVRADAPQAGGLLTQVERASEAQTA